MLRSSLVPAKRRFSVAANCSEMTHKAHLLRLMLALIFFTAIFGITFIFTTFRILSSQSIRKPLTQNIDALILRSNEQTSEQTSERSTKRSTERSTERQTEKLLINIYEFWGRYYNDDRLGRPWTFKVSQKYDVSKLHPYTPVVVEQKDALRPGTMGENENYYVCIESVLISIWFFQGPLRKSHPKRPSYRRIWARSTISISWRATWCRCGGPFPTYDTSNAKTFLIWVRCRQRAWLSFSITNLGLCSCGLSGESLINRRRNCSEK